MCRASYTPVKPAVVAQGPEAGLPAPDLVLYLRMPNPEDAAQRGGFGNERYIIETTPCIA